MEENKEWVFLAYHNEPMCSNGFEEYVSKDGKWCKQVWDDGYIETFEIEQTSP